MSEYQLIRTWEADGAAWISIDRAPLNVSAIVMFLLFVVATLAITTWLWSGPTQNNMPWYFGGKAPPS